VLPTVRHSVTLRPHRFFTHNPAMDFRSDEDVVPARNKLR
jgi:Cu2+-containing amine oxidase